MTEVKCAFCEKIVDEAECWKFRSLTQGQDWDYYCKECQDLAAPVTAYLESRKHHDPMDDDPNRRHE